MSLVYFSGTNGEALTVHCERCSKAIGDLSIEEIRELSSRGIEVLCFDCDRCGVDDIPRHLFSPLDHYLIGYDEKVFLAEWVTDDAMPEAKDLRMSNISLTTYFDLKTGYGPTYAPLSSSLYLNKKSQKSLAFLRERGFNPCSP